MPGEGLQSDKISFQHGDFLHSLMASIAVQYLLAETTGQMVVAHQSSCTTNSQKFPSIVLYSSLPIISVRALPTPPLGPRALAAGEGTRCPACGVANHLTEDNIQQHRMGMAKFIHVHVDMDATSRTSNCIVPVNRERSISQLQLLLRSTHVDLFSNSSKS